MTKKTTKTSVRKKAVSTKKTTAKKPAQKKDSHYYICTSNGLVVGKMKKI